MKVFNVIYNIFAVIVVLCFVFTAAVKFSGTEIYAVATTSMEDELHEGDMVFVRAAQEYLAGDVITARLPSGGTFTHRINLVDTENGLVYTQGDNNPQQDPLPTAFEDIIGKVVFSVPLLGNLALKFTPINVMIVLAVAMAVLILVRFLLFYFKKPKEDEAI